ncbi:MAG: hypothetical protein AAF915_22215 [Cyanobacteria bacterium P01_D01_bin.50]
MTRIVTTESEAVGKATMNSPIILFEKDKGFLTFFLRKSLENILYNLPEITNLIE